MNKLVNKTIRSNLGLFKASSYPNLSVMSNLVCKEKTLNAIFEFLRP